MKKVLMVHHGNEFTANSIEEAVTWIHEASEDSESLDVFLSELFICQPDAETTETAPASIIYEIVKVVKGFQKN